MSARDWYAEGFRYEQLAFCHPGDYFTISYVENDEVEEIREIQVGAVSIVVNGRIYPKEYRTWIRHIF